MPSPSLSSPNTSVSIDVAQLLLVVGEILLHADAAALESHDRHQIGRRHLRLRCTCTAALYARSRSGGGMRRHVEVQHDAAACCGT